MTFLLTSCSALGGQPLATSTPLPPTPTPILSPTIVWFPPTETPTPRASSASTPTPDWSPGLGGIIASDDFTDPANWNISESDQGSASLRDGQLTLAASPGVYLMSLNQKIIVGDFYAEITAHISLCRGDDEYGLLFRAIPAAYYRFSLDCNGQARLDRVGSNTRYRLQLPQPTSDAPRGGPAEVRLSVWAVGREMRFLLNGHYQFTVSDAFLKSGALGVFVRAAGDTPITISFSNLVVREVNYSPPAPTP